MGRGTMAKSSDMEEGSVTLWYGSIHDAEAVYNGTIGYGSLILKNYTIYSPHKIGDGWDVERWPKVPTWK